jgi:hypothetical protein
MPTIYMAGSQCRSSPKGCCHVSTTVRDTVPCGLSWGRGAPQFDPPVRTPSAAARPHEPVDARGYSRVTSVVHRWFRIPLAARKFPGSAECAQEAQPQRTRRSLSHACAKLQCTRRHCRADGCGQVPAQMWDALILRNLAALGGGHMHGLGLPLSEELRSRVAACQALPQDTPRCNRLQRVAPRCAALQRVAPRCNGSRRVATGCAALQQVAPRCNRLRRARAAPDHPTARNELRWAEPGFRTVRRGSAAPKRPLVEPHFAALTVPARAAV